MSDATPQGQARDEATGLEIAIIGMACRFPGANSVEEFWENVTGGVESITRYTDEELEEMGEDSTLYSHPDYVKVARAIDGIELFDAAFFGSSPREAEIMDPQQRHMLQCAWQALEDAGYDSEDYDGLIGLFAGSKLSSYLMNVYSNAELLARVGEFTAQIANDKDYVATRVAYKLNLGGPSINVQTACSTSLVATHLACQALLSGECDMALAGGVSLRSPQAGYVYVKGEVNSPDGRLRPFDAKANGTIFGSGLGLVVLKRLEDALADGDRIRAVIRGTAVNNDASLKVGYTAPGVDGQMRVIRAAQTVAEVEPRSITYVEAHGTGTPTGDPIEVTALTRAFRESTQDRGFCALGSVKGNVGHLSAAAGVAGLIKTTLALENRQLPPSILFDEPNPQIDFDSSPFFVNTELRAWEAPEGAPLRAGVSAFGIGGTNAHAIVEEAPALEPTSDSRPHQLLPLSARSATALETITDNLAAHLADHPDLDLADVAYTLARGRRSFEHRRTLVARDAADAAQALADRDPKRLRGAVAEGKKRPVAFLFSGQGAQYPGMGEALYRREATFAVAVDRCSEILEPHLGRDLRELLYPAAENAESAGAELAETRFTQPALFVTEYATAQLWMEWGIEPDAMIGHSIGEYVAACLSGVLGLDEALALVAARGRLMQSCPPGSMLAVPLTEDEVKPYLDRQLSIAAINAPNRCVVSGPDEAIEALQARLAEDKVRARPLHTSHAFHSDMMEPILAPFADELSKIELRAPRIPYVSNVTGRWIRESEAIDPDYWVQHLRLGVRFADGLSELYAEPDRVLLEVGPGNTLTTLASRHPDKGAGHVVLASLPHPKDKDGDALAYALGALGQLWIAGVEPDWKGYFAHERRRRVGLPVYPFEGRRFWIEKNRETLTAQPTAARKQDLGEWFSLPAWKPSVTPAAPLLEGAGEDARRERWLIFADGPEGLAGALGARLAEADCEVLTAAAGESFASLGDGRFELAPAGRDDYQALFAELKESDRLPQRIVHLWNVTGGESGDRRALQERGFYSLLYLAQAIGKHCPAEKIHLAVISDGVQHVGGEDGLQPEKATLLGPCQVIPKEYPNLVSTSVDVVLPEAGSSELGELVESLVAEASKPERGALVAYRGGERWLRDYEPVRVPEAVESRLRVRPRAAVLITGGLGGFGLTFAEYLAREHQARLVLCGRSALPERERWDEILAGVGDERAAGKIRRVRELESLGAEVMVASADVTDPARLRELVGEARERFGALHGVIHAAGLPGGGMIQLKTAEMAEQVLAPKVDGTLALAEAVADEDLDFFVLCSSTIAVLGTFGQVDYCAGNCFLDAFAEARHARGDRAVVSINWGAWQEVGMAVETVTAPRPQPASAPAEPASAEAPSASEAPAAEPRAEEPTPAAAAGGIHPLLDERTEEDGGRVAYESELDPSRHWVLDEHRIMGKPALPGTTYLELARAAFAHHQGEAGGVEIRDVFFYQPLMVPEGETQRARILLEPAAGGGFRFRVESLGSPAPTAHVRGEVGPLPAVERRAFDLEEIVGRCERTLEVADGQLGDDEKLVYWGPRWRSLKKIHLGSNEALARLVLPEGFASDLEEMALHPAMVDVATALTSGLAEGESYLPLSYRKVRVHGPLPGTIYSYLRVDSEEDSSGETLSADISLLDEEGREVVAIERFTMKRVGAARERLAETPAAEKPAQQGMFAAGGMLPREGVEVLRRVLSRVRKPRVVVSPRDLEALRRQSAEGGGAGVAAEPKESPKAGSAHPRPHLSTPYAAPESELEKRLAEIWQEVLGLEDVGIHDNFFELGGDSVMGITVISQAAESGLELAPEQLFEHQTVAELAALLEAGAEAPAEGGDEEGAGEADLAPDELEKVLAKLEEIS